MSLADLIFTAANVTALTALIVTARRVGPRLPSKQFHAGSNTSGEEHRHV